MSKLSRVLLALGAFLVVIALGCRFYAYERLAVIPSETDERVVAATAPGADATYFSIADLETVSGPLQSTTYIKGDPEAADALSDELGRDVVVWTSYGCTDVPGPECNTLDEPLSGGIDHYAMDRHTGELIAWDEAFRQSGGVEEDGDVLDEGLLVKFPFNTQQQTYQFWDASLHQALDVEYRGRDEIDGLDVYVFEQEIAGTKIGEIDVPGDVVGAGDPTVTGDRIYSVTRTFLVEPTTGVVIDRTEALDTYLEVDGERALTLTEATLRYDETTVADTVDTYRTLAVLLRLVQTHIPVVGGAAGLILIITGLLFSRRRRPVGSAPETAATARPASPRTPTRV